MSERGQRHRWSYTAHPEEIFLFMEEGINYLMGKASFHILDDITPPCAYVCLEVLLTQGDC